MSFPSDDGFLVIPRVRGFKTERFEMVLDFPDVIY